MEGRWRLLFAVYPSNVVFKIVVTMREGNSADWDFVIQHPLSPHIRQQDSVGIPADLTSFKWLTFLVLNYSKEYTRLAITSYRQNGVCHRRSGRASVDEMSSEPKKKHTRVPRRRKHAVGVCASCRKRHIKCDLARPTCSACKAVGVTCDGYDSELRWTSNPGRYLTRKSKSNESGVISTRRHLYSEKDRISMSVDLRLSLVPGSVDNSLQEIDGRSKEPPFPGQGTFVGPFGFINLQPERELDRPEYQRISEPVVSLDELIPSENPTDSAIPGLDDLSLNLDTVEDCLNWPDLFNLEDMWPDLNQNAIQNKPFDNTTRYLGTIGTDMTLGIPQQDDSQNLDFSLGSIQVEDAELLLKRYQDTVISHSFSFPLIEKSPWEIVNVNAAVMTLSRINYLGTERVTHASMANLLTLIATSAAHKAASAKNSGDYNAVHWENIRAAGYSKAKSHLQESLKNETGHIKKAKYKDQFMAVSAMLSFAVCYFSRYSRVRY